jgi:hypothetical protein
VGEAHPVDDDPPEAPRGRRRRTARLRAGGTAEELVQVADERRDLDQHAGGHPHRLDPLAEQQQGRRGGARVGGGERPAPISATSSTSARPSRRADPTSPNPIVTSWRRVTRRIS